MLTFAQAREKAKQGILEMARALQAGEYVILDEHVRERGRGWTFPYDTKRFLETGNPLDGIVGNGPVFVDRETGQVYLVPSGGYDAWLDEYDRTGAPPRPASEMHWVGEGPALPFPAPRGASHHDVLKFCGTCGSPVAEGAKYCPNCGTALPQRQPRP